MNDILPAVMTVNGHWPWCALHGGVGTCDCGVAYPTCQLWRECCCSRAADGHCWGCSQPSADHPRVRVNDGRSGPAGGDER